MPLPPPEELLPHPGLGRLLAALGAGPEGAGLGVAGGRSLRRAEAELGRQRAAWLAREGLWRAVLELLREPRPQEVWPEGGGAWGTAGGGYWGRKASWEGRAALF